MSWNEKLPFFLLAGDFHVSTRIGSNVCFSKNHSFRSNHRNRGKISHSSSQVNSKLRNLIAQQERKKVRVVLINFLVDRLLTDGNDGK